MTVLLVFLKLHVDYIANRKQTLSWFFMGCCLLLDASIITAYCYDSSQQEKNRAAIEQVYKE